MRVLLPFLLVASALVAAAPVASAQPCYPDACCGSTLSCLLWPARELVDRLAFDTVRTPTSGGTYACAGDPRSECPVFATDGYRYVCVL